MSFLVNKMISFGNLCAKIQPFNFLKRGYRSKRRVCCNGNNDPFSLRNKIVVTTGGAEGIGYEMSKVYLERGARVTVLLDNQEDLGRKTAKELSAKFGKDKAVFMKCDVRYDLDTVYNEILDTYRHVDVLINNAGVLNDTKPKKTIEVNVIGTVLFGLKFWEHMRMDRGGRGGTIINLSSIYGYRVDPWLPVYQCTKFAVMGFTKSLGHEFNYKQSGVRVVSINPGFTTTTMTHAPKAWNNQKLLEAHVAKQEWQELDAVGRAAVEVFENAPTGTAWVIEGNHPICSV